MRINKKKFIYLISPNKIYPEFYHDLNQVLRTGKVALFQLRLKKYSFKQKIVIGKRIQRMCKKNNITFIINDDPILSKTLNADGCHLGQKDMSIKNARKIIGKKIIGVTCHNSIKLAKAAINGKADYIAFGAFFSTNTKKVKYKAAPKIINKAKKLTKIPIVAIGGINMSNYKKLLLNNADLLAISSYVWNNKKYKPYKTIEKIK